MNILTTLLPEQNSVALTSIAIDDEPRRFSLNLTSVQSGCACPVCNQQSGRVHSRYTRMLADLPWADVAITIRLHVRRFFCDNPTCACAIFTERLPTVMVPWARRTNRLAAHQQQIGVALGGAGGARLCERLGIPAGVDLVLNLIRQMTPPFPTEGRVIGVDDWAFCKGHTYGTIIVDLEQGQVLDLLPDRQSEALAQWLLEHPGITIVSRDRAGAYAEGVRLGAPEAEQVADRWHLLKNVAEALLQVLTQHQKAIANHLSKQCVQPEEDTPAVAPELILPTVTSFPETAAQIRRQKRIEAVQQRHQQGWSVKAIGQELRLDCKTVRKHLQTKLPLLRQPRGRRHSLLDPYKSYLLTCWQDGCHNAAQLWRELQAQGFVGKERIVRAYVGQLRFTRNGNKSSRGAQPPKPCQLVWRALKRAEEQADGEDALLVRVRKAHPEIATALALAQEFASLVRQRQSQQLNDWLGRTQTSKVVPFRKLALSLQQDYAAVKAALTLSVSNGPVEGHINRLKLLKRQMYGRAKLDLLRNRLMAAWGGLLSSSKCRKNQFRFAIDTDIANEKNYSHK